jgi:beta-lactamase regulating signal transducer with metallopeptidase domain
VIAAWMVYALLVGALVAGAALGAESVLRVLRLPVRPVWTAALVLTVALVGMAPRRVAPPAAQIPAVEMAPVAAAVPAPAPAPTVDRLASLRVLRRDGAAALRDLLATAGSRAPEGLGRWLMGGWALASVLALLALAATHGRYRRLRRRWPLTELDGLAVRVAPATGPAVVGLHRPEIVLPRWLLDLPAEERRLVLAHEQEHVRARDPLLLAAGCAFAALLPWHPASWWMLSRLRLAVEYDCDARVLRRGLDRRSYGTLLIDLAGRSPGARFGLPALADEPTHLERRLLAMTSRRTRFAPVRALPAAALAGAALLVACEAKLPTADDVARMDVSAVEAIVMGSEALGGPKAARITYMLDDREVSEEEAKAVDAEMIRGISMRTLDADQGMIVSLSSGPRREAMKAEAAASIAEGVGEAIVLIDNARADLAAYRALEPSEIEALHVVKDPAEAVRRYGPAAAGGLVLVTTKSRPRVPGGGGNGRAYMDGRALTRAEMEEILARPATPPTIYLIDGVRADRAGLSALPDGEVWSLMIADTPTLRTLYGAEAANGVVQVMTKTGSQKLYSRLIALNSRPAGSEAR